MATHTVQTPGTPHHVEVFIPDHPVVPVADGSDMIPVYFKICDKNGTRVNTSDAEINITVCGEGRLLGDSIRRIGINPQRVEGGIGFAFVRTTKKAGKIRIRANSEGLLEGEAEIESHPFEGEYLPDGQHAPFMGKEEDGVVVKPTRWDRQILEKPKAEICSAEVTSAQDGYPESNLIDGDDFSWWIAGADAFPQVVTLALKEPVEIIASRIRFQKDSSSYKHWVEVSEDGASWELLYERECTGWEFKRYR